MPFISMHDSFIHGNSPTRYAIYMMTTVIDPDTDGKQIPSAAPRLAEILECNKENIPYEVGETIMGALAQTPWHGDPEIKQALARTIKRIANVIDPIGHTL